MLTLSAAKTSPDVKVEKRVIRPYNTHSPLMGPGQQVDLVSLAITPNTVDSSPRRRTARPDHPRQSRAQRRCASRRTSCEADALRSLRNPAGQGRSWRSIPSLPAADRPGGDRRRILRPALHIAPETLPRSPGRGRNAEPSSRMSRTSPSRDADRRAMRRAPIKPDEGRRHSALSPAGL